MSKITKETALHIAKLAALKFDPKELDKYTQKFKRVLEYVEKLNELKTDGIEPTSHAIAENDSKLRDDINVKFEGTDEILSNRLLEVPKVLGEE